MGDAATLQQPRLSSRRRAAHRTPSHLPPGRDHFRRLRPTRPYHHPARYYRRHDQLLHPRKIPRRPRLPSPRPRLRYRLPRLGIDFAANSATRSFYRVHAESVFAPLDPDNDGIDDVYELNHPDILDPLDPDDADLDPDDDGSTHLQDYLRTILDTDSPPQYYSRELTTFNLGASLFPTADAISRELTTFNFGVATAGTEALSRELAIYNGSGPPTVAYMPRVVSRQTSVFNFPVSTAAVEALSRQLTLYNGSGLPTVSYMKVVTSREVTAFNYPTQTARIEAISREVSVNALMSQD